MRNLGRPVVGLPMAKRFTEIIAMNMGELGRLRFLLFVDKKKGLI